MLRPKPNQRQFLDIPEEDGIVAYTDGSSSPKKKDAAWAFTISYRGKVHDRYGYEPVATNQFVEVLAILRVLQFVKLNATPLVIYTDNMYAKNSLMLWSAKWARQEWTNALGLPIANKSVIMNAYEQVGLHDAIRNFEIKFVKGHTGNPGNERAHTLAHEARVSCLTNWKQPLKRVRLLSN